MAHDRRHHRLRGFAAVILASLLSACQGNPISDAVGDGASPTLDNANPAGILVYSLRGKPVDDTGFVWLGPPAVLGGRVLEGDPQLFARLDYMKDGMAAGLFKSTTGRIEVTFPFTEHATILEGEVTITDALGQSHLYKPGDSYFIRQGQQVIWDVKGKQLIKSFFNTTESP